MGNKKGIIQKSILWSGGAEIGAKLIVPISNMILARILVPEDFGVVAICNMLISFIDLFTDAGFGKYMVQHDFEDEEKLNQSASVAFWTNFSLSVFLWGMIVLNRNAIAAVLGGADYADVIAIACIQLMITSISSIQLGILRRSFSFKRIFMARIAVAIVPLIVTVPLALLTRSYWALVIGNIVAALVNAVFLWFCSNWHPKFFYSFALLKEMLSYSLWSLCEALAHWLIFWIDTLIIGQVFSNYYLGIYKNSTNMIQAIFSMITSAFSPVLFASLSRIKDGRESFTLFLHVEKIVAFLVLPLGIGIFFYSDLATTILFGSGWEEAGNVVGAWALMMTLSTIIYAFPAEAYKAKGMPHILFFYQLSYIVFFVPLCFLASKIDFWTFVYVRTFCIIQQAIIGLGFMKKYLKWNILDYLKNLVAPVFASLFVLVACIVSKSFLPDTLMCEVASIVAIVLMYFAILLLFFKKDIRKSMGVINHTKTFN